MPHYHDFYRSSHSSSGSVVVSFTLNLFSALFASELDMRTLVMTIVHCGLVDSGLNNQFTVLPDGVYYKGQG